MRSSGEVVFGDVTYQPGGTHGPRVQQDYQLVLLYSGHADVSVDGLETPLHIAPGHAALLRPGRREHFRFSPDGPTHHGWCAVHPSLVEPALAREIAERAPVISFSPGLAALVRLGLAAGSPRAEAANRFVTQLGKTALLEFLATAEGLAPALPAALQRACACMDAHFAQGNRPCRPRPGRVRDPGASEPPFQPASGHHARGHLWRVRVENAVRLLRETGLSVAEIAERTGFQNPFHLSRLVKKACAVSPRELRHRVWNTPPATGTRD